MKSSGCLLLTLLLVLTTVARADCPDCYKNQQPLDPAHVLSALAEYDRPERGGDGDGAVGPRDAVYAPLRLRRDANHDGLAQADELGPLPAASVESISLDYREARRRDRYGNEFRYRARVNGPGGPTNGRWAYDVFLLSAP